MTRLSNFLCELAKCIQGFKRNSYSNLEIKSPQRPLSNVTIAYISNPQASFISNIVNVDNFLNLLSRFVRVVIIPVNLAKDNIEKIERLDIDYLYADLCNFNVWQFILRERHQIDTPFIAAFHTVHGWVERLRRLIPFVRDEDIIITPSGYAKEAFSKISDKVKIRIMPYCLDIKNIQDNIAFVRKPKRKIITFMGQLKEDKGIGTLIKCMPRIAAEVKNLHLNIIGPLSKDRITDYPKSSYVSHLEKKIRRLGLTKMVHFKGVQLGLDKYRLISESDIFINPTTAKEENFPMVNLEALACGIPVISTNWAGIKEAIIGGKNGYLVNTKYDRKGCLQIDTGRLTSLILKLLTDKKLNNKMKAYTKKAALKYDYRRIMPRLVKSLTFHFG